MDFSETFPDSCTSVALSARSGNLTRLKELVREKKSLETQDNRGWRPIHEAAHWNHSHCLEYLLNLDIQVNCTTFEGQTALWLAACNNCITSVETLLKVKAMVNIPNNEDVTPLHIASSKGFLEVVGMLIKNGANVNMKDYGLFTALHEAAIAGHFEVVEMLLKNGADKTVQESHGRTPLFCAAQSHSCQVVYLFLSNAPSSYINMRAADGATAVMLASQSGCLCCVKLMVELGADTNLKAYDGVMAAHLALIRNRADVLRFLLTITDHSYIEQSCLASLHQHHHRGEANWNQPGMQSVNIFTLAVTYDRFGLIQMLVEEGLIPDRYPCQWKFNGVFEILQRNKSHSWKWGSPLSFILSHSPFCEKSAKAVEFLVQAGANVNTLRSDFIPPFIALLTAAGWENDVEFPLLSNALKLLIQKGGANHLRAGGLSELMHAALALNPRALISLIHTGYIVDASAIKYFSETSHISAIPEPINLKFVSILYEAGFLMEFNVLPQHSFTKKQGFKVHTLMELSRHKIHSILHSSKAEFLIPEWDVSLPRKLFGYLCYDDMKNA